MTANELRAVVVVQVEPHRFYWRKVEISGQVLDILAPDPTFIVSWLHTHGFEPRGAFVDDALAVCWLRAIRHPRDLEKADAPEKLSDVLGARVVPATCAWSVLESRIVTTRRAGQIRRSRRRNIDDSRDLAYIEKPTQERMLRTYGLIK